MRSIYKFAVNPWGEYQNIALPVGSKMLSVIEQNGHMILYCLVDPTEKRVEIREYLVVGTGWNMRDGASKHLKFIGTVKIDPYVWHFFERVTGIVKKIEG